MSVQKYALKFHQLSRYDSEMVSSMRARMRKFTSGLSQDLILESKDVLLIEGIDILRLVMYIQKVEKEKKKQAEIGKRQHKKFRFFEQVMDNNRVAGRERSGPRRSRAILGLTRWLVIPTQSHLVTDISKVGQIQGTTCPT